jgi:methylenetetrahydrofolate dehydrogenase (NADP+)/methenyltetrahydrofolate cyclohydrolase
MPATLLDGKQLARTMRAEIAVRVADFARTHGRKPGLAAVLVGENDASQKYVRNKRKACQEVGMESWLHELPVATSQAQLLDLVTRLNAEPEVDGILVQLPCPSRFMRMRSSVLSRR